VSAKEISNSSSVVGFSANSSFFVEFPSPICEGLTFSIAA